MPDALLLHDGRLLVLCDGLLIGRAPECELHLDDPAVSRRHAVINSADSTQWQITDLGSRNGTYVDDAQVEAGTAFLLRHDCRLRIASAVMTVSIGHFGSEPEPNPETTASLDLADVQRRTPLTPYQLRVLQSLSAPWLLNGDEPASNSRIADDLGTPNAESAVKAALRRIYAKAGLSSTSGAGKRRALCQVSQRNGWI